jgi:hypothetical protein
LSDIYLYSGVDSSKCTDWTTTRRAGYKPEPNEPQYRTTRGFNSQGKSSKKSGSKKRSAVTTNKHNQSSKRSGIANKSKSIKGNLSSDKSTTRTTAM